MGEPQPVLSIVKVVSLIALRGELLFWKERRGLAGTASSMPDGRNANTDAECGQIQYNHNKSK
jgi:hypothetical protein